MKFIMWLYSTFYTRKQLQRKMDKMINSEKHLFGNKIIALASMLDKRQLKMEGK